MMHGNTPCIFDDYDGTNPFEGPVSDDNDRSHIPVCCGCGSNENVGPDYSHDWYFQVEARSMVWWCGCGNMWCDFEVLNKAP